MKKTLAILSVLLAPTVALAAAPRTLLELADLIVRIINAATAMLILLAIVVYFFGVSTNILEMSEHGREKVRAYFFWGIVVLFVMVSIWGIIRMLQSTIFGDRQNTITMNPIARTLT
jgi:hypothetical protein